MARKKKEVVIENENEGVNPELANAIASIEKQFGKGAIMMLGDDDAKLNIETISSGSIGLDVALGVGGIAKARITEIYGPESAGKTTLTLHIAAEAQKAGGVVAFIDAEHALDLEYARRLGVKTDELLLSQPDCGEQALEITEALTSSGAVDLIIIDSVAALTPRAEIEGDMGASHMGLQARLMSQALRKLTHAVSTTGTSLIFINQIRMKIGVMFGNPETTTGGNALKFYATMRLEIRKAGAIKQGDAVIGNQTKVKVVKNKVAPPFKQVIFDIIFGEGISQAGELVDIGVEIGVMDKAGAWYAYNGENVGQGRENTKAYLLENPEVAAEIKQKIYEHFAISTATVKEEPQEEVIDE